MLTVFPLLCLQLVTAHFKHGERTWSAENIEGEYHFGSIYLVLLAEDLSSLTKLTISTTL